MATRVMAEPLRLEVRRDVLDDLVGWPSSAENRNRDCRYEAEPSWYRIGSFGQVYESCVEAIDGAGRRARVGHVNHVQSCCIRRIPPRTIVSESVSDMRMGVYKWEFDKSTASYRFLEKIGRPVSFE